MTHTWEGHCLGNWVCVALLLGGVIRKLGDGSDGGYGVALNAAERRWCTSMARGGW